MKKLLLFSIILFSIVPIASSQTEKGDQSVVINAGFQSNADRFLVGGQYRYTLANKFRVAPDLMFFFPNDRITGLDINMNFHYVFDFNRDASFYPLAGVAMQNNRFMGRKVHGQTVAKAKGYTDWAFNLGGGFTYELNTSFFLNTELKYMFGDEDCFVYTLGFGFNF